MENAMTKHEAFVLDCLLPIIMVHAAQVECDPDEAALAVFMSLGAILVTRGFTPDALLMMIRGIVPSVHEAPEVLQ